jgi:hypothetical protein
MEQTGAGRRVGPFARAFYFVKALRQPIANRLKRSRAIAETVLTAIPPMLCLVNESKTSADP